MAKNVSVRTKKKHVIRALLDAFPDLVAVPGRPSALLNTPMNGVVRGVSIDGSKFKDLYRIQVFAFLPCFDYDFWVLSDDSEVASKPWWNFASGELEHSELAESLDLLGLDLCDAVVRYYEKVHLPWLNKRRSARSILECMSVPQPSDAFIPPKWYSSGVRKAKYYMLACMACGELDRAKTLLSEISEFIETAEVDDNIRRIRENEYSDLLEVGSYIDADDNRRQEWLELRSMRTLEALKIEDLVYVLDGKLVVS